MTELIQAKLPETRVLQRRKMSQQEKVYLQHHILMIPETL